MEKLKQYNEQPENEKKRKFGGRLLKIIKKNENKETKDSEFYLMSERIDPFKTPFGRPGSSSKKDIKAAKTWWSGVCETWDKEVNLNLPLPLGKMLEEIIDDPNYYLCTHHSNAIDGQNFETDEVLHSILETGLLNLGDASSGAFYKDPPVSKTVTICPDMFHTIINTKSSYKHSSGSVILKIPSEYINQTGSIKKGMESKVYNYNESGYSMIKPEFILGFIQNDKENHIMNFTSREDILKNYNLKKGIKNEDSRH